jgi:transposase
MKTQLNLKAEPRFIGIDYHKRYSVYCVLDQEGAVVERGRIEHLQPEDFLVLVRRWPGCRLTFEAGMNWCWLYDILEGELPDDRIVLANPYKTRIIAEAQIKTDKVDAYILAQLLRGNLISSVHIGSKENRQRKEVLRQRAFFVRQRTMLRNRIHRLLGAQHDLKRKRHAERLWLRYCKRHRFRSDIYERDNRNSKSGRGGASEDAEGKAGGSA